MFRTLTTNSLKQGQRVSTKAFQHQPPPSAPTQPTRLFNTLVEQQQPQPPLSGPQFNDHYSSNKLSAPNSSFFNHQQRNLATYNNSSANAPTQYDLVRSPHDSLNSSQQQFPVEDKSQLNKQLALFDECLLQNSTYDLATGKISGGVDQFWVAVRNIIPIYSQLIYNGIELNERRMGEFVSLLRNGLRIHRLELSKLKKNLDKDSNNPIKNIHHLLTCAIREVSYNVLDNLVTLNPHGLTHLFKAYKDLGFTFEAVHIWETGKNNPKLNHLFTSEPVLGSIFPFLVESGDFNFDEVWSMYRNIKSSKSQNEKLHNELQVGMIRVCLFKGKTNDALEIFQQLTSDVYSNFTSKGIEPPINVKSYMTMAHLSFIGFSKDIDTADVFYNDAVNELMPYLTPLQLNFIKKYLSNTWEITHDYSKVKNIWLTTWKHYESKKTSNSSVSSSLNDSFLSIFFKKYPVFSDEGFSELKRIILDYNSIRSIDEPLINVLLSKSIVWNNLETFEFILNTANSNTFSKTNVFYRCCLKACGSIDISTSHILTIFRQLLSLNNSTGMKYIAHADWISIRDATINSVNFRDSNDRIDLYFKLFKICSPYFISLNNYKNYIYKDIKLNYNYSRIFQQMTNIKTDLDLPEISYLNRNGSIDNYIGYTYY